MRKIIASARVSLDGVMQGPDGAQEDTSDGFDLGGWIMNFRDAKGGAAIMGVVGTLDKPYDLLLGRKTYDSSWKRQKALRQHLAPREHEAGWE